MKNLFWKTIVYLSVLAMTLGLFILLTGAYNHNYAMAYFGVGIIVTVCISWSVWLIATIKVMIDFTNNAAPRISDIRNNIKEVRQLFNEYKKLRNR
jgi:hypothetical protein